MFMLERDEIAARLECLRLAASMRPPDNAIDPVLPYDVVAEAQRLYAFVLGKSPAPVKAAA